LFRLRRRPNFGERGILPSPEIRAATQHGPTKERFQKFATRFSIDSEWLGMAPILGSMTDGDITSTGGSQTVRRHRDSRRHSLEQLEGEGSPRTVVLEGDEMLIGRAP
jgi:hypothetical protein